MKVPRNISYEPGWTKLPETVRHLVVEFCDQPKRLFSLSVPDPTSVGEYSPAYAAYGHTQRMGTQAFWRNQNGAIEVALVDYYNPSEALPLTRTRSSRIPSERYPTHSPEFLGWIRKTAAGPITVTPDQMQHLLRSYDGVSTAMELSLGAFAHEHARNRLIALAARTPPTGLYF
jgi:hypothetical protein